MEYEEYFILACERFPIFAMFTEMDEEKLTKVVAQELFIAREFDSPLALETSKKLNIIKKYGRLQWYPNK